jgi:general stress protein 26
MPNADHEGVAKVAELMRDIKVCMLTTADNEGQLMSRPMAAQQVEFDGDLWFYAARDARKVDHVRNHPGVNVSFSSGSSWVSLSGSAVVIDDRAKARELWNTVVEAWFPDGPDDPNVVLLRVEAESAEYWDTPGGRVASLFSFVKAKATGEPYDGGENERVDL